MPHNISPDNMTLSPQESLSNSFDAKQEDAFTLSSIIKDSMVKQGLSLRQLSRVSTIPAASLSKILNSKQPAGIRHIQLLSQHLNIPIEYLLSSIGIAIETGQGERAERPKRHESTLDEKITIDKDTVFLLNTIEELLNSFGIKIHSLVEDIQRELIKYEHYARTEEGRDIILQQFAPKLATVKGSGGVIDKLTSFYQCYCSEDLEDTERAIIGSALLYFALSPDVIPDYAFPLGFLDDAIAVNLVAKRLAQGLIKLPRE